MRRGTPAAKIRHLGKAPVIEAIVDFRVSLPPDFRADQLRQAQELLAPDYPKTDERKGVWAQVALVGSQPPQMQARDLGFQGVWLKAADEKTVAQFRTDGFTFNRLKPSTRWEEILPEALRLWRIYVELAKPQSVTRVALRYINQLPLPGRGIELDDYIVTSPKLPRSVPQIVSGFATRVAFEYPERRMNANVVQVLDPVVRTLTPTLLFDIDVYRTDDLHMTEAALRGVLDDLRAYKNAIFFGSLRERFVKEFQ